MEETTPEPVAAGSAGADAGAGAGAPAEERPPLEQRAATFLLALAAAGLGLAVVTGIPLVWAYRPQATGGLRAAHAFASTLFLGATAGLLLVTIVAAARRRPVWSGWAAPVVGFAAAAAASFSGSVLAWDLVAFSSVTTGEGVRIWALTPAGADVRFALVGSHEITPGTFLAWFLVHVVVVTGAAGVAAWLAWRRFARAGGGPGITVSPG